MRTPTPETKTKPASHTVLWIQRRAVRRVGVRSKRCHEQSDYLSVMQGEQLHETAISSIRCTN